MYKRQDEDRLLLVSRTFSKIYGLAALRVGYALTSKAVAGFMGREMCIRDRALVLPIESPAAGGVPLPSPAPAFRESPFQNGNFPLLPLIH